MRSFKPKTPKAKPLNACEQAQYREKLTIRLHKESGYSYDYLDAQTMAKIVQLKNRLPANRGIPVQREAQPHRPSVKLR